MRLSAHYNKTIIVITLSVLLTGAVVYYFAINYIARTQLDRDLTEEIDEVLDYVKLNHQLPRQVDFDEDVTVFKKTDLKDLPRRFFDTVYINPKGKKSEAGRAVSGLIYLKDGNYKVTITISREDTEYLVQIIAAITLLLMVCLLLILFLTNRYILRGLWRPFYDTLYAIKAFNVSDNRNLDLKPNKVDEFSELNTAVHTMSTRVKNDFQNLKQFTENASHEMLTPLAVITSKLDTLIQDETIKPELYNQINDIYAATSKLSRLNQSLLLLVKIENNLIDDIEWIDLDILISEKIKLFNDLLLAKHINITEKLEPKKVWVSKHLIDILLNNLFSNAIRHNAYHGELIVKLTTEKLSFQNSGPDKSLNGETIFERFHKGHRSEGAGLGLAIVKNICSIYKWHIYYEYLNSLHAFQIVFPGDRDSL
jgi:signal transduction histidine kinase